MAERVAIVGAESTLLEAVRKDLAGMGIGVEPIAAARDVADRLVAVMPDLALIVHDPPRSLAFDSLRNIRLDRTLGNLPTVIVGKDETAALDAIVAFELGTDDFVRASAGHREIALRARAVMRRTESVRASDGGAHRVGPLEIDVASHSVSIDGAPIALTAIEFRLLVELARHRGRTLARHDLLERIWSVDSSVPTRTLDTHVKRLREKMGRARNLIETVRGVGYRLRVAT